MTMDSQQRMSAVPDDRRILFPGSYFLDRDLVVDDTIGILIRCSDVVLNLNGHTIAHAKGPDPNSFGILVSGEHRITILNGCIDGFWHGIHLIESSCSTITDMAIRNNGYIGIYLTGNLSKITNNLIEDQRIDLPRTTDLYVVGINVQGIDVTVAHNKFNMKSKQPAANVEYVAILVSNGTAATEIQANSIRPQTYLLKSYGVWVADDCDVIVSNNEIGNVQYGVTSDSKSTKVTCNILRNDDMHADTHGVFAPKNTDRSLLAGNTIEGFEHPTVVEFNEGSEPGS